MKDYITTYSKVHFEIDEPKIAQINLQDVAHALSMLARANGHLPKFYSVAQHSLACTIEAMERNYSMKVVLGCLLHDGSEAYLCDITRPVKQHLDYYLVREKKIQNMIFEKLIGEPLNSEELALIHEVDDAMLFAEFKYYLGEQLEMEHTPLVTRPVFVTRPFDDVEEEFLSMYYRVSALLH